MRSHVAAVVVLSVVAVAPSFAQSSRSGKADSAVSSPADSALKKTILDLEAKRIGAMVHKDLATLDALLADDLTYTHSGGTTDTKASFIALIKERGRYLGVDYSKTEVIPWGGNTVLVRGLAQIRLEETAPYTVIFADVWALRDGKWKMVAWQATREQRTDTSTR
jgi:ketosteroid isomerase-like protein